MSPMTDRTAQHASFTIERRFRHPLARVFAAFSDAEFKKRWFSGDEWTELIREFDFRVGGRERVQGRWASGVISDMQGVYFDIVENARIVMAYQMEVNGKPISVSLGTSEFRADGRETVLKYTEQGVYLDGFDDAGGREHGTRALFDRLEKALDAG